jgi:hypothetical protein
MKVSADDHGADAAERSDPADLDERTYLATAADRPPLRPLRCRPRHTMSPCRGAIDVALRVA